MPWGLRVLKTLARNQSSRSLGHEITDEKEEHPDESDDHRQHGLRSAPHRGAGKAARTALGPYRAAAMDPRANRGLPARRAQGTAGACPRKITISSPAAGPCRTRSLRPG